MRWMIFVLIFSTWYFGYASETVEGAKKDYQKFKSEMSAKLDSVEAELKILREKAAQKSTTAQQKTLAELESTRDKLKAELDTHSEAGQSNWKKFKLKFADSIDKLNTKIQKALKD